MKSRKPKPIKAGASRKKVPSDVSPSTSLPPLVEGHLRCFLRVTISRVLWTVQKPPSLTFVRLRWWGESSNGTYFLPRDGSQLSQKTLKTTARFAIRCGPRQFTSYLADMGSLVLESLTKPDHLPIARAQVAGISRLSLSHSISGFYTLVSPTSEKLGELQVSLSLEPLTEAYDSSNSCPITDNSTDTSQVPAATVSSQPVPLSSGSSGGSTPRGKDHLYFQITQTNGGKEESLENERPRPRSQERGQSTSDILSVILERGNKLRNAMVESALKSNTDSAPALKDTPLPLPKDNIVSTSKPSPSPSGMFLQNILHADSALEDVATVKDDGLDCPADMDNRAVDLLLGSLNTSPLPLWDGDGSPPESLSGHSSVCVDSELNDPLYDQSLLENLFYKTPISDEAPDDPGAGNQGTSSSQNQPKKLTQSKPQISGHLNPEPLLSADAAGLPPGLNPEQMTLLSLIRLARVNVDSLTVPSVTTPRKPSNIGRPPRPGISTKCTYFIEYAFPKASTSSRRDRSKSGDGEVTRAVASKVTGGAVKFRQHSVFPVNFSTTTVKKWWETDLTFKIYSRKSHQKKPVPIGKAVHPLRSLLQSKQLCQSVILPLQHVDSSSGTQELGPLKVSLELTTDKDFSAQKHGSKLARRDTSPSQTAPSPHTESSSRLQHADTSKEELPDGSFEDSRLHGWSPQKPSRDPAPHPSAHTPPRKLCQQVEEDPEVLLHTLLMVPDGKNFICGLGQAPNVYLNCKLFWCDETARSVISWGQADPSFNFVQVTPVALTSKLLERMQNNVMVIEVWQKMGGSGHDRLLGLVKLPLHQFYMSFRDPKVAQLLLQARYPVLGVDCYMPVVDVFTGTRKGQLRVVLALGQSEQIVAFQRSRNAEFDSSSHLVRPVHLLDHQRRSPTSVRVNVTGAHTAALTEHLFVIRVEKVNGLTPLQSTVWGEADCYVQYSFPCQEGDPAAKLDQNLIESSLNLRAFRTTTTLCVPDPLFSHTETHVLLAPEGVPAQRLLLSLLSGRGLSSGGGVQFEVWCRYYYPNVRDQLVAKGLLPLSKLCAIVTMQRQHPDETQMFSLPLIPRMDSPGRHQPQPSGVLDVCVQYKHRPVRPEGKQTVQGAATRLVTLVVKVHRASGLQAAARHLSERDERFSYFASVGVNSYVMVQLSFLPESETRCTRVAAKSFCPEFDHHTEVPCDLLLQRSSGETCSLAEQLEEASAVFTVWNKDSRKGTMLTHYPKDVMLGTLKVPLADLIKKRTGISGWFGLCTPHETSSSQHILVGGLELSISFAHHSDRERVIQAAQGVGWEKRCHEEETDDEDCSRKISLTFSMPRAWIPVHCLLLPSHTELQRSTYCYFRYKFYDQDAFCSHVRHPSVEEEGQAMVAFQGSQTLTLSCSQPLMWYLREERLEVQVWVAFKKDKTQRPRDTDWLIGSAFVDLSTFAITSKKRLTLSGVYPLFRRSAADLQGAALRVHITLTEDGEVPAEVGAEVGSDSQEELLPEKEEAENQAPSPPPSKNFCTENKRKNKTPRKTSDITSVQHSETSLDESFPVTVSVDRAMHLNLKGCPLTERSGGTPCCCVSYLTADSDEPASTGVITNTDCPVWDHQHECRLSKQLLVDPQQSLVFKVWHKGDTDRVLGFASVDLSPLLSGFPSVCGWYNITDFSGQCHGQLKVSVTPLKGVQDLRGQRKPVNNEAFTNLSTLLQTLPLSYHTTATYSSFPAHISRYPEQKISSPDHTEGLFSEGSSESDRHLEHMDKVRLYHQSLQEKSANSSVCSSSAAADINPSSSYLLSALRKKLSELDNIQRYFSRKLSTPTFPPITEQDVHPGNEVERDEDMESCQLLLKSNQLVGEVNSIISGLQDHTEEQVPVDQQRSSTSSPAADSNLQTIPENIYIPHRASHSSQEDVSELLSPQPKTSEDSSDSESEEVKDGCDNKATQSEDEHMKGSDSGEDRTRHREEGGEADCDGEEEEDEDYEEVVVKPRALNEMTSLTDKTSPWTSILSDPDLVSLQSLEASEEPELNHDEEEKHQTDKDEWAGGEGREQSDESFTGSAEVSHTEREDEKTSPDLHEEGERDSSMERSCERSPSLMTRHTRDTHDVPGAQDDLETPLQASEPVEVPNFFLPSHQLEASMRAIRLAPSFTLSSTDPGRSSSGQTCSHLRGPRQQRNMSPSSMRKKTERIAEIFAAHFDNSH